MSVATKRVLGIVQIDDGSSWFEWSMFCVSLGDPVFAVAAVNGPTVIPPSFRDPRTYDIWGGKWKVTEEELQVEMDVQGMDQAALIRLIWSII